MPLLHWSPRSPYVRKVMLAFHEKGLADAIQTIRTTAHPVVPQEDLMLVSPLSKIPTLEREDGLPLGDSRVIMEGGDRPGKGAPRLFPEVSGAARNRPARRGARNGCAGCRAAMAG